MKKLRETKTGRPKAERRSAATASDISSARAFPPQDDLDSLRLYYRRLGESEPLSPEDEQAVWQAVERETDAIRGAVSRFGFVMEEQIRLLRECMPETASDFFLESMMPPDSAQSKTSLLNDMRRTADAIETERSKLLSLYRLRKLRGAEPLYESIRTLVARYPVNAAKLMEWNRIANVYCYEMSAMATQELEEKLLPDLVRSAAILQDAKRCFARIESLRKTILTSHLRLVVSIAKHYRSAALSHADLIQEGNIGLIKAFERFDYRLGHKFSTYATWWIKHDIARAIANQSRVIRMPQGMMNAVMRINRAEQAILQRTGREPGVEELARELDLSVERVRAIRSMASQEFSLQVSLDDSPGGFLLENIQSESETSDPERQLAFKIMCAGLNKALKRLPEREQLLLRLRYGLDGQAPKTQVELSRIFGLSRERLRQLEQGAIRKLRNPDMAGQFGDYFG